MRELKNVIAEIPGGLCFVCHPTNEFGLRLKFWADDSSGEIVTRMDPKDYHTGFPDIVHGGVQCAILDEVAWWTVFDRLKKVGVTKSIELRFLRAARASSPLEARGKITSIEGRDVHVSTRILNEDNEVCTMGMVTYHLPEREEFFKIVGDERIAEAYLRREGS